MSRNIHDVQHLSELGKDENFVATLEESKEEAVQQEHLSGRLEKALVVDVPLHFGVEEERVESRLAKLHAGVLEGPGDVRTVSFAMERTSSKVVYMLLTRVAWQEAESQMEL